MAETEEQPGLVDAQGRPLSSRVRETSCPRCGSGPERRVPSSGFGDSRHPVCGQCGYDFHGERLPQEGQL